MAGAPWRSTKIAVELAAAVVGDNDTVGAEVGRSNGVFGVEYPLDDEGTVPGGADPIKILPEYAGIEISAQPAHVVVEPAGFAEHGSEIGRVGVDDH